MTTNNPKRVKFRTLLLLLTIGFVLFAAWLSYRANEQRKMFKWVRHVGGLAEYKRDGHPVFKPAWGIDYVATIVKVQFFPAQLMGEDYKVIYGHDFEALADATPLAKLKGLKWLSLEHTQVSDLTPLAELKNLEFLHFNRTPVTDLTPLAELTNLEVLSLSGTKVRDLTPLAKLTNLKELLLIGTQVSDLSPLANLNNLEILFLSDTQVSDVSPLTNLKNLKKLALGGTQVSDASLLANLTSLEYLDLSDTKVTKRDCDLLQESLWSAIVIDSSITDSDGVDTSGNDVATILDPKSESDDETDIRSCYDAYYAALFSQDGPAARKQLSLETVKYYGDLQKLTLNGSDDEIGKQSLIEKLFVAVMRRVVAKDKLNAMSAEDVVEFGILMTDAEEAKKHGLGKISITGDKAVGEYLLSSQVVPGMDYEFRHEDGVWKLNLVPSMERMSQAMKKSLAQQGMDEDSFVEASTGMAALQMAESILDASSNLATYEKPSNSSAAPDSYKSAVNPYMAAYEKIEQKLARIAKRIQAEPPVTEDWTKGDLDPKPVFTLLPESSNVCVANLADIPQTRNYFDAQTMPNFSHSHNGLIEGLDYCRTVDKRKDSKFHASYAAMMVRECKNGLNVRYLVVVRPATFKKVEIADNKFTGGTGTFDTFFVHLETEEVVAKINVEASTAGAYRDEIWTEGDSTKEDDREVMLRQVHYAITRNFDEELTTRYTKLLGTTLEFWAR